MCGIGNSVLKGTMLLDATCCLLDIPYPAHIGLLNKARALAEIILDELHKQLLPLGFNNLEHIEKWRKKIMGFVKRRKYTSSQLRYALTFTSSCNMSGAT